jgi:universal stress protein E
MNKLKSIVVGVDLSKCSRCALQQAARMAQWHHARLHVIHAVEHLVISDLADAMGLTPAQIETATVRETKQRLGAWLPENLRPEELNFDVEVGPPIDVLLRKVRAVDADLLVLGLHGDSTRLPSGAGTLATKCMRKAPTKVLLVQEQKLQPFRTVLACVDFSESAREAVAQALRVGVQDQSQIHFLHVFQGPWHRLLYRAATTEAASAFQQHYRLLLEQRLKEFVGETAGLDARFKLFDASSHGGGIAEYAQQVRADLVVLGTKGRTNLGYVLLGSTVERLLRELPCSALTVRASPAEQPSLATNPEPKPTDIPI